MFTVIEKLVLLIHLLAIFLIVFYAPYFYAKGLFRMVNYTQKKASVGNTILAMIPGINILTSERVYLGKFGLSSISIFVLLGSIVMRLLNVFLLPSVMMLNIITVILLAVAFLLTWVLNSFAIRAILRDVEAEYGLGYVLLCVIYPLGQVYIGNVLYKKGIRLLEGEDTF